MAKIRELFDSSRALTRQIEKVISYQHRTEAQLRAEITEYVVTDHIERSFEDLLKKMQLAQQGGGGHEIGVWVSGFYGSGKSSFTKYLGFSLDRGFTVGGDPFVKLLQNQLLTASTRALFNQVAGVYDAAVIFLDLASEMLAGASMEDISTVLYLKVLKWAGYSEDLKVAELERMLEADGKLDAFKQRVHEVQPDTKWDEVHNQPLVANQIAAELAVEFYPKLFKKTSDFGDLTLHVSKPENRRTEEMVALIRRVSGKKNIIFIIDEVGQYVSAKPSLILNLDGLAKNLKQLGGGSVWIFSTAQQTLTDDNPTAALNSPGLYKLKDRFPIQIHLEAGDIKEICHKRLLTKSAAGEQELGKLFDTSGASLRTATQLTNAGVYSATELTRKLFIDLYPFLPSHFEMLLQLLGRLAKKTGGLGLRSAIKVVQEVLIERSIGSSPLADAPVGNLANTVTFYNSLRRDIQSSFPHVVEGVSKVEQRLPHDDFALNVAKSIAVLQILENLPVTAANLAALMQPNVASPSLKDEVEKALAIMLADGMIPLGEKDGGVRFLTQAAVTLQKQFEQVEYRQADVRAELNGVLRSLFQTLPSTRLAQVRPVSAGIKVGIGGGQFVALEGDKEPIQFHLEFVTPSSYETTRTERENDSRASKERTSVYLLGRADPDADQLATTLVRCNKFLSTHRTASDLEVQEFIRIVEGRAQRTTADLERKLSASLLQGSFVAHGAHEAVSGHGAEVLFAANSFLAAAAAKVFDRYTEASLQADSGLAEKFLTTHLDRITSKEDPLGLVSRAGGKPQVKVDHKALVSLTDYLGQNGQVEGRRLLDHFSAPPFGWSKDTTRYLLAAAFLGGSLKLRIAGQDHQVKSDEALTAFSSNKQFGAVGISLRAEKPNPEALARASDRLRDLSGENILPLEDEIAVAAKKHFPAFQALFGPLAVELRNFGLPAECSERAESLVEDLTEVVSGDGSDAVKRFGGPESPLHDDLVWARNLKKALDNGLQARLTQLQHLRREIASLPDTGTPAELKVGASETLHAIDDILSRDAFFAETAALAKHADALDKQIADTVAKLAAQQAQVRETAVERWSQSPAWQMLDGEARDWLTAGVGKLVCDAKPNAEGLRRLLNHDYTLNHQLRALEAKMAEQASQTRAKPAEISDPEPSSTASPSELAKPETLLLPASLNSAAQLRTLIAQLTAYLAALEAGKSVRLECQILPENK